MTNRVVPPIPVPRPLDAEPWRAIAQGYRRVLTPAIPIRDAARWLTLWRAVPQMPTHWRRALECELEAAISTRIVLGVLDLGEAAAATHRDTLAQARRVDGTHDCRWLFEWDALMRHIQAMETTAMTVAAWPVGTEWTAERLAMRVASIWTLMAYRRTTAFVTDLPIAPSVQRLIDRELEIRGDTLLMVLPRERYLQQLALHYEQGAPSPAVLESLMEEEHMSLQVMHDVLDDLRVGHIHARDITPSFMQERLLGERLMHSVQQARAALATRPPDPRA